MKSKLLVLLGWAVLSSGCSNPFAPEPEPEPTLARNAEQDVPVEPPIIARTSNRDVLGYLASLTGSFRVIDGCLSFERGETTYTPVFPSKSALVFSRTGFAWGGRKIRFGEKVRMGGGQAQRWLEIDEEAKRKCRGPFIVINNFPPRSKQELDEILSRRKPPPPKGG